MGGRAVLHPGGQADGGHRHRGARRAQAAAARRVRGGRRRIPNHVVFRLGPDVDISLGARTKLSGRSDGRARTSSSSPITTSPRRRRPYQRLLTDAMEGDAELFSRQDVVERSWEIVDPVLGDATPVHPYTSGSWGPDAAGPLIDDGGTWHNPRPHELVVVPGVLRRRGRRSAAPSRCAIRSASTQVTWALSPGMWLCRSGPSDSGERDRLAVDRGDHGGGGHARLRRGTVGLARRPRARRRRHRAAARSSDRGAAPDTEVAALAHQDGAAATGVDLVDHVERGRDRDREPDARPRKPTWSACRCRR